MLSSVLCFAAHNRQLGCWTAATEQAPRADLSPGCTQGLANYSIKFAKEAQSERGWSRIKESPASDPGPVVLEKDKLQQSAVAEAREVRPGSSGSGSGSSRNVIMPLPV